MATQKKWQLSGDYFENCNCDVVCPCLVSPNAPLTAQPTQGACDVAIAFHIDRGDYDGVPLDDLQARTDTRHTIDLLTQFDSLEHLRHRCGLDREETVAFLRRSLTTVLA